MPFTRQKKAEETMNTSPYHNHTEFNSDLNVHVSGGDRIERELLVDQISTSLKTRGFERVHAIGPHGFDNGNSQHNPKSVFDQVKIMRPDMLKKDIAVTSTTAGGSPFQGAPVKFEASDDRGNTVSRTDVSAQEFMSDAGDRDLGNKVVVTSKDRIGLAKAAQEVLLINPDAEVTMKLELEPWQRPYKPAYAPPYDPSNLPQPVGFAPVPQPF